MEENKNPLEIPVELSFEDERRVKNFVLKRTEEMTKKIFEQVTASMMTSLEDMEKYSAKLEVKDKQEREEQEKKTKKAKKPAKPKRQVAAQRDRWEENYDQDDDSDFFPKDIKKDLKEVIRKAQNPPTPNPPKSTNFTLASSLPRVPNLDVNSKVENALDILSQKSDETNKNLTDIYNQDKKKIKEDKKEREQDQRDKNKRRDRDGNGFASFIKDKAVSTTKGGIAGIVDALLAPLGLSGLGIGDKLSDRAMDFAGSKFGKLGIGIKKGLGFAKNLGKGLLSKGLGGIGRTARTAMDLGKTSVGLLGRGASAVGRFGATALEAGSGIAGKAASSASSLMGKLPMGALGKVGKFGLGGLAKVALPLQAAMSAFDAYQGYKNAADISGKKEKDLTAGDKIQAGAASVISGLSFGLVDSKRAFSGITKLKESLMGDGKKNKGLLGKSMEVLKKAWEYSPLGMVVGFFKKNSLSDLKKKALGIFNSSIDAVKKFFGNLVEGMNSAFSSISSWVSGTLDKAMNGIKQAFSSVTEWVSNLVDMVKDPKKLLSKGMDFLKTGLVDPAVDAAGAIKSKASEALSNVGSKVSGAFDYTKEAASGMLGGVKDFFGLSKKKKTDTGDLTVDLLKRVEGYEPKVYKDAVGYATVGYGSLVEGKKVDKYKEGLSEEEATGLLKEDISKHETYKSKLKVPISKEMEAAMTSFAFNLGANSKGIRDIVEKLNAGDAQGASQVFLNPAYSTAKDKTTGERKTLPGLEKRRLTENALFLSGVQKLQSPGAQVASADSGAGTPSPMAPAPVKAQVSSPQESMATQASSLAATDVQKNAAMQANIQKVAAVQPMLLASNGGGNAAAAGGGKIPASPIGRVNKIDDMGLNLINMAVLE